MQARNTGSGDMLDGLQWPTLEAWRDQSSQLLFHKIHSETTEPHSAVGSEDDCRSRGPEFDHSLL